ncbi:hypothetical protein CK203_063233 [Vitis vinifera]|uniref:Reverse transcriptase Ty1/copia-type domain-containing protein n=1 Tax=Vitis vinifera TaxID=29760 RepID=A0A438FSW6_VITVI|nr:hypothetical protein CK203_063233 [Vitis vinifera]
MGKLQIEDRRQQEEVVEDPKKEESPLALPPPQHVQEFSKCMHSEFEMSMMGELNFFLGLQIKQLKEGTFINQAKYIRDLLKRFNMEETKTMKTPMSLSIKLDMDEKGKLVNSTMYRGMIGTMDIGLWYPKGDNFELIRYSDANFAGCKVERKSASGTCHFLGHSLVSWHSKKQNSVALSMAEAEYIAAGLQVVIAPSHFISFSLWTPSHFRSLMAPRRDMGTSRAQGKHPLEPSQPEQTEARRKTKYDMNSSVRMKTISATSKKFPRGKSSQGEVSISPNFSTLTLRAIQTDGMATSSDDF